VSEIGKFTNLEENFIDIYTTQEKHNATQAYIDAGYEAKNRNIAGVEACKLLRNPKIKREINKRTRKAKKLKGDKIATLAEIQEFYTKVLRSEETEPYLAFWDGDFREKDKKPYIKDKINAAKELTDLLKISEEEKKKKEEKENKPNSSLTEALQQSVSEDWARWKEENENSDTTV